jgi:hypothetical protein
MARRRYLGAQPMAFASVLGELTAWDRHAIWTTNSEFVCAQQKSKVSPSKVGGVYIRHEILVQPPLGRCKYLFCNRLRERGGCTK